MRRALGNASDFYRLRLRTIDATESADLDWRDDILYRRPPEDTIEDSEYVAVEAVALTDANTAFVLATFESRALAYDFLLECEENLAMMTRSEFEATFFANELGNDFPAE